MPKCRPSWYISRRVSSFWNYAAFNFVPFSGTERPLFKNCPFQFLELLIPVSGSGIFFFAHACDALVSTGWSCLPPQSFTGHHVTANRSGPRLRPPFFVQNSQSFSRRPSLACCVVTVLFHRPRISWIDKLPLLLPLYCHARSIRSFNSDPFNAANCGVATIQCHNCTNVGPLLLRPFALLPRRLFCELTRSPRLL